MATLEQPFITQMNLHIEDPYPTPDVVPWPIDMSSTTTDDDELNVNHKKRGPITFDIKHAFYRIYLICLPVLVLYKMIHTSPFIIYQENN